MLAEHALDRALGFGTGIAQVDEEMSFILSLSSTTSRSAVFLPTPGMRVRRATSLERSAATSSGASIPDSTETASCRSKSACSTAVRKPKSASVSSRTCVWVSSVTSAPGSPTR